MKATYTKSPWSGKSYAKAPAQAELAAESMNVLNRHSTISRAIQQGKSFDLDAYYAKRGSK